MSRMPCKAMPKVENLRVLMEQAGQLVTREQLFERLRALRRKIADERDRERERQPVAAVHHPGAREDPIVRPIHRERGEAAQHELRR